MRSFYEIALAPLGIRIQREHDGEYGTFCGFGRDKPELWLARGAKKTEPRLHIALLANNRAEVRAFYDAAMKAAPSTTAAPASARSITRITTARSSSIPKATISKP